jgi:hypothetical protein
MLLTDSRALFSLSGLCIRVRGCLSDVDVGVLQGGYDLAAALCHISGESSAFGSACRVNNRYATYEGLTVSQKASIYQGSRSFQDIYCHTQRGFAGIAGSERQYRRMQGCIRYSPSKPPKKPGLHSVTVIAYSKSYDQFSSSTYSSARMSDREAFASELGPDDWTKLHELAYVKTTIDLLVFLAPSMHYCAQECTNAAQLAADPSLAPEVIGQLSGVRCRVLRCIGM